MSARYFLLLILLVYVFATFLLPALQSVFGYSIGGLVALVILWYVFIDRPRVL